MRGPLDITSIHVHAELLVFSSQENAEEQPVPFFLFFGFSVIFGFWFNFLCHKLNCLQVFVS